MQLIVAACRRALGNAPADDVAALVSSMTDWPGFVRSVDAHAVAPIVYAPLAHSAGVPAEPLARLRAAVNENALRSIVLARTLRERVALFEQEQIPVISIKGPLLARAAYGDLASRRFADLDLVVHRRDLDRARALLAQRGYQPAISLPRDAETALLGADYHIALVDPERGIMVELHWALMRPGLAGLRDETWAWTHACDTTALGTPMRTLTTDATFVYLCVHGSKHLWSQLGWLCDVAALARTEERTLSWPAVRQLAAAIGATRMVALGCALASELLGAAQCDGFGAADAHVRHLVSDVRARLFDDEPTMSLPAFQLRVRTRFGDRIAYLAEVAAAPHAADVQFAALPRRARALYYVLRPARLVVKHGRRAFAHRANPSRAAPK
jgi:hypothetical protein